MIRARFPLLRSLVFGLMLLAGAASLRADPAIAAIVKQPAGSIIVPDQFVRPWDPVTIFFDKDTGPAKGGAEDQPDRFVTVTPAQPGAFAWLNARTLQFRPAEAWPALGRFTWKIGDRSITLASLLDPPVSTVPANGAANLDRVDSLTLEFAAPVDPKALAEMLDIAMAPLPGLDPDRVKHLSPQDFDIKPVERKGRSDHADYVVALHQPIPNGMRVLVKLGLSTETGLAGTVSQFEFSTAESFRPIFVGCAAQRVPLAAQGTIYDKTAALTCKTEQDEAAQPAAQQADASSDDTGTADTAEATDEDDDAVSETNGALVDARPPQKVATTSADQPAVGTSEAKQTVRKPSPKRRIVLQFSAVLGGTDPIAIRNLVRITPAVEGLKTETVGDQLRLTAKFATDTLYQIGLEPTAIKDKIGRTLDMPGRSVAYVFWPAEQPFLALAAGNGVVERFGPQMIPLRGRGYASADVRIHEIDPLDRSFWPFPRTPVKTMDSKRPPSPGEEAAPVAGARTIQPEEIAAQIDRLGSASLSSLMSLPLTSLGASARFGLDLAPGLARVDGKEKPGTYLVGIRPLDKAGEREWMRVQVTNLSLTAVEEEHSVRFVVTSLSDGKPVEKAQVKVEGTDGKTWQTLSSGQTVADGHFTWDHVDKKPGPSRIVVVKDGDTLVIDPNQAPDRYTADGWFPDDSGWLDWMGRDVGRRHPLPRLLCHVFTERPIYRPDDPVHIKAYVRQLANGLLTPAGKDLKAEIVVQGPDDAEWRQPVTIGDNGSVHELFEEKTTATGTYHARIDIAGHECAIANFKKDAYRLPRFQVRLDASKTIPLDKPTTVGMTATYYAGGPANDRPVRWRVTQFPYAYAPKPREGFVYATDARYQSGVAFDSTAAIERQDKTDAEGRASLALDPTRERTNQPRRYVVEATVIGDDDKTVTNTEEVLALPAFVLGVKAPRYLDHAKSIPIEFLMVDGDGKPVPGRNVTLRLLQRQWSSILQASDFTDGKPKYRTEVVDQKRVEKIVTTGADTTKLDLPISESGVYVVELSASDALGRRQTISVDLFAGGDQAVTWSRPPSQVFKVTPDKANYAPGETAALVLESPFQTASALAIVEQADGTNHYEWVDVKNGYGKFNLPIDKSYLPRVPVHFALMRGRLKGDAAAGALDLLRPQTIAATAWVGVKPTRNIVTVAVDNPQTAQPGDTIDMTVKLSDETGKPMSGEVTLWLIDQAVLALAKEAPLDPLPRFIRDRGSRVAFSDTRNGVLGYLPLDEDPGGDVGDGDQGLLNKVSIRKNFTPVPYYNPSLMVDDSGTVKVSIKLPDNLTVFRVRAKAVSGPDRFGFATGQVAVRLPVIVEPNLPRFVRPGDQFALSAIGRIVEGGGGPAHAEVKVAGLTLDPATPTRNFDWAPGKPQRLDFPVTVPSPGYTEAGDLARTTATVTFGIERTSDKAHDAFSVDLPIRPDREPVHQRQLKDLTDPTPFALEAVDQPARPGTIRRTILVSSQPALVRLMAGLTYLREYPFGCTEQQVSLARAEIATKAFATALQSDASSARAEVSVKAALTWIASVTDENGLVSFWPGGKGQVTLTAWVVQFMVEARKAGFAVDNGQLATLTRALKQSLRSDYANFVSGEAYAERTWALAALAAAGEMDRGYAAELTRKADQLSLEGLAEVRQALAQSGTVDAPAIKTLNDALWNGIIIKQRDGKPVYGGLQQARSSRNPLILASETRTVAEVLRATAADGDPRRQLLADALVTLGKGNGWGDTNANAAAMLALSDFVTKNTGVPDQPVAVTLSAGPQQLTLSGAHAIQRVVDRVGTAGSVTASGASPAHPVAVQSDLSWLPVDDGSKVAPASAGFVVAREADVIDLTGAPAKRQKLDKPGSPVELALGDVVEDSVEIVNPADRHQVAIVIPLASGMEPLNPGLATAPPEATPSAEPTLAPTYVAFLDDEVRYFYETLPKGTYDFHFRSKASVPGRFIQPAAHAEMMYEEAVRGNGAGALVTITRPAGQQ
ncbi:MAG TPA: alpha-2-macroglobulin family protein [Aliidongia sp.]|uniref:alpha-2-macroglobulin n=1 Tax=Aliidongia sp. TaxID=1914230 RepID=UPI002DDCEB25|nr:alpha-2-macroglobulin family protein [Aliidongia sp.]HEV2678787.1 alpha-2-macroglobulin family protein [Aliidongia sp.]